MILEDIGKKLDSIFSGIISPKGKSLKNLAEEHSFSDFLPYRWYDPDTQIFVSDNSIGFVLETSPLVGNSENMQRELSNIFTHILPEESYIQTILYADKNIGGILKDYVDLRETAPEVVQSLVKRRAEYLSKIAISSHLCPYVLRDFKCYMSVTLDLSKDFEDDMKRIQNIRTQIVANLNVVGVDNVIMNATDVIQLLDSIFNMDFTDTKVSNKRWHKFDLINDQIIDSDTDICVEDDILKLRKGQTEIKTFSLSQYPPEWTLYQMAELVGDMFRDTRQFPCPFIMHYGVYIPKQSNNVAKIALKASLVERQMRSPIGKYIPHIEREYAELDFTQNSLNKGEKLVKTQFSIVLFSRAGEMAQSEQTLKTMFSSLSFRVQSNYCTHLHSFLTILPLSWNKNVIEVLSEFKKLRTTISIESSNLVPQQAEWKGTSTPAMLLGGRKGQLIKFCPFDNRSGNYNVTVVGRSGAGKSVFMQELMSSTLGMGGRVFVLDVGRSFEKTCQMFNGQFLEFSINSDICLNPFSKIDVKNNEVAEDTLAMLKSVIQLMAAPINGVNDKEAAILEQATRESFKKYGDKTTITAIVNYLRIQDDDKAKDLSNMLYPYGDDGSYGKYFNRNSNIDLDNPLVVIELEELKEKKTLQSVVVQMMIINITNKMFLGDRKTPFNIVFDEAWDMLREPQSELFIETLARRLRKYRGSLVVGTQSVNDFYSCAGALAAWDNSDWNCFLAQKSESIRRLKEKIPLDVYKERVLRSVKTEEGRYAEVMINGVDGYAVGKLLLDPFSNLLFSTKPEDYTVLKDLINQGYSITDAVEQVLQYKEK